MTGINKQGQEIGEWDMKRGLRRKRRPDLRRPVHQDFPSKLEIVSVEVAVPFQVSKCHCWQFHER